METKSFKDPIYGYVKIPSKTVSRFIDSPSFQRLRNIIQTSYTSLYSASLHNRFIHSLGVYHLGTMAYDGIENFLDTHGEKAGVKKPAFLDEDFKELFSIACLLHDIGHAPFSHTGEDFFLKSYSGDEENLHEYLYNIVNDKKFENDARSDYNNGKIAKPHEFMSVIVSLKEFSDYFKDKDDKVFFARCILGYQYRQPIDTEQMKNCFISLLNSSLIDVDKLDYLIRDSYVSGYQNVSLDYVRLLQGFVIINHENKIQLGYHKNASSIIEKVIFAHNSEKKWVQGHPIIIYESYLIEYGIRKIENFFDAKKINLFQYEALTKEGIQIESEDKNDLHISLLSDDDIKYHIKNICKDDGFAMEYFDRDARRSPLWKSQEEYLHLLRTYIPDNSWMALFNVLGKLCEYLMDPKKIPVQPPIIDDSALERLDKEIEEIELELRKYPKLSSDVEPKIDIYKKVKSCFNCFKNFSSECNLEFNFVILSHDLFRSSFVEEKTNDLLVWFPNIPHQPAHMKDVLSFPKETTPTTSIQNTKITKFFYFYYKKNKDKSSGVNIQEMFFNKLCKDLLNFL